MRVPSAPTTTHAFASHGSWSTTTAIAHIVMQNENIQILMIANDTFTPDVMLLIAKVFFDALGINIKNTQINKTMLYFYKIGHIVLASDQPARNKLLWSSEDQSIVELEFDDTAQVKTIREGQVFMPSKTNNTIQS